MRTILFLSNNSNSLKLAEWLKAKNLEIICLDKKVGNEDILTYSPSLIISYNYRYIISRKIIELMNGNIINLHISFLPWNRGANPNFWSFVEKTPKGVTIHKIDEGLDTGPIILQKEIEIDDRKNTFRSSYEVLHSIIQELFRKNYLDIMNGLTIARPQVGLGSYHNIKEFEEFTKVCPVSWDDNIRKYLDSIKAVK